MKQTWRYYRTKFTQMKERGWTIIPWAVGQANEKEVVDWLKENGNGEFYYCTERNKHNWSIVIEKPESAAKFKEQFKENHA